MLKFQERRCFREKNCALEPSSESRKDINKINKRRVGWFGYKFTFSIIYEKLLNDRHNSHTTILQLILLSFYQWKILTKIIQFWSSSKDQHLPNFNKIKWWKVKVEDIADKLHKWGYLLIYSWKERGYLQWCYYSPR